MDKKQVDEQLNDEKVNKSVIIPIIRKINPSLIASQMVGVQPMSGSAGLSPHIFRDKIVSYMEAVEVNNIMVDYYAVKIQYGYYFSYTEIQQWCENTFIKEDEPYRWYMRNSNVYLFKSEEDRNWFLLRWS